MYQDRSGKDVAWNRGAYLIQGLGHCACCMPRGVAFQEKVLDETGGAYLTGALLDGWFASNLTGEHARVGRWSEAQVAEFLKTGADAHRRSVR